MRKLENVFSIRRNEAALITGPYFPWKSNHRNTCKTFFPDFWNIFNTTHVHITALVSIWLITNEVCTTCIIKFEEMF